MQTLPGWTKELVCDFARVVQGCHDELMLRAGIGKNPW